MTTTPKPGLEGYASYGGPGWQSRAASHHDDIGSLWRRCSEPSEVGRLRQVSLARPGDWLEVPGEPNDWLLLDWPDRERLEQQAAAIGDYYRSQGAEVHWLEPSQAGPNFLFQRDLYLSTRDGIWLSRPAHPCRAAEAPAVAAGLASLGFPLLGLPQGRALFEGADALWVGEQELLLGLGRRSNQEALAQLRAVLAPQGVKVHAVELLPGVQHLLGTMNWVDRSRVVLRAERCSASLRSWLDGRGLELLELPESEEVVRRGAMNFVTLAPGHLVMPSGCPVTRGLYRSWGLKVDELEVSEYLKAAGALGCLTGILEREAPS